MKKSNKINVVPVKKAGATLAAFAAKTNSTKPRFLARSLASFESQPKPQDQAVLDGHLAFKPFQLGELIGRSLVGLGVVSLGLLTQLILISGAHYTSAQIKSYEDFRYQLANGTAPVGQVDDTGHMIPDGTAVALLQIKTATVNVKTVVLEGTASSITMDGAGHKRDSVLPGQHGVSVIYGRQAAYGGVFSKISTLKAGDQITVTTGQGESKYQVSAIRRAGDKVTNDLGTAAGRLTLVTAEGIPFMPNQVVRVDAQLIGDAKPTPTRVIPVGAIEASNQAMAGDMTAVVPAIFLAQGLILVILIFSWSRRHWGKPQAWIVASPLFLWLGSMFIENIIRLLPNLI